MFNAGAQSVFHLFAARTDQTAEHTTSSAARQDVFTNIEMFYNPTRKHTNNGMLSPGDDAVKQKK